MARAPASKKEKLSTDKPESPLSLLKALGQFGLIVLGIVGLAVAIFSDQGLLVRWVNDLMEMDSARWMMGIPIAALVIYVAKTWFERTFGKSSSAVMGSIAMYGMMVIGFFFLIRLLHTGSF
jgi:uncharacterized protein YqgC (DUF456 family)